MTEKPRGAVVIPKEYATRDNPFAKLTLPDGRDVASLRYVQLFNALSKLDIGIKPTMGSAEMIRLYEKALQAKADELAAHPAGHIYSEDTYRQAAKALAGAA